MSHIKIEVPNDDEAALHYFGEAMIKLSACVRGEGPVDVRVEPIAYKIDMSDESVKERLQRATQDLMQAAPAMLRENDVDGSIEVHGKRKEVEVDTTSQQVESLAHTDSTGTPWDERIHSASKALNADGTWRLRRKPADKTPEEWADYVKWVEEDIHTVLHGQSDESEEENPYLAEGTELRAALDSHKKASVEAVEPAVTPEGDDFHVDTGVVTEQQVADIPPPPPPVPQVLTPIQEAKVAEVMTFPQVMAFLTERHGRITSAQVDQIIADMGLEKITDLNTQPEQTGPFIARVKALLGE